MLTLSKLYSKLQSNICTICQQYTNMICHIDHMVRCLQSNTIHVVYISKYKPQYGTLHSQLTYLLLQQLISLSHLLFYIYRAAITSTHITVFYDFFKVTIFNSHNKIINHMSPHNFSFYIILCEI